MSEQNNPMTPVEPDETREQPVEDEVSSRYLTIGERLGRAEIALTNALESDEIRSAILPFNYTEEKLKEGERLLRKAKELDALNHKEYGEQYGAKNRIDAEFKEASGPYMVSLGVARIAFRKDREAARALVLSGRRKKALSEWTRDAEVFYRNLLSNQAFLARMSEFGRTMDILKSEYKEIQDVIDALAQHKREMGEAQQSTANRDEALEKLEDWLADFYAIAKLALADKPDSLQKMGL